MKIRNGFVSNSSSSSFVIISSYASVENIDDPRVNLFLDHNIICPDGGRIYFRPDEKTIELIKNHPEVDWGNFVYEFFSCDEEKKMNKKDFMSLVKELPDNFEIECFEIDHWQPSYKDILERVNNKLNEETDNEV